MVLIDQIAPARLDSEIPPPLEQYRLRFLGQGDSWFSLGAVPPTKTANLFFRMAFPESTCVVNCAQPGELLRRMADSVRHPVFLQLLNGNKRRRWDGLLLSGGGNDVIEAIQVAPEHPPELRLLARPEEWRDLPDGERYLSDAGWKTFGAHLRAVFDGLIAERDERPDNRGIPVLMHTYDFATPRPAGAGLGRGPWLQPALVLYGVPRDDWVKVSRALQSRLAGMVRELAASHDNVHVVDTLGTLSPATTQDTGATAHWANEIHPSKAGYELLARKWTPLVVELYRGRWEVPLPAVGAAPGTGPGPAPLAAPELLSRRPSARRPPAGRPPAARR